MNQTAAGLNSFLPELHLEVSRKGNTDGKSQRGEELKLQEASRTGGSEEKRVRTRNKMEIPRNLQKLNFMNPKEELEENRMLLVLIRNPLMRLSVTLDLHEETRVNLR